MVQENHVIVGEQNEQITTAFETLITPSKAILHHSTKRD
jgi:hypothetical protein